MEYSGNMRIFQSGLLSGGGGSNRGRDGVFITSEHPVSSKTTVRQRIDAKTTLEQNSQNGIFTFVPIPCHSAISATFADSSVLGNSPISPVRKRQEIVDNMAKMSTTVMVCL